MAELNPNIILSGQAPQIENPMDLMSKAMAFRNMASESQMHDIQNRQMQQEFNDNQTIRNVTNKNTSIDANGNVSMDQSQMLKDLAKDNPMLAMKVQSQFAQTAADKVKIGLERASQAAQMLQGVKDEDSYQKMKNDPLAKMSGSDNWPPSYDSGFVASMHAKAIDGKQYFTEQKETQELAIKKQEMENKQKELQIEGYKAFGGPIPGQLTTKGASHGTMSKMDPATLIRNRVPPALQSKAYDQLAAAQNTAKSAAEIMQAFDDAANNIHAVDFVPTMHNKDQKALHALMGPTFQDVEGTVRQAAMDNMNENTTPQFLDSKAAIATKRAALLGYLQSKSAAPLLKDHGIDLSQYDSTHLDPKIVAGNYRSKTTDDIHPELKNMSVADLLKLKSEMSKASR